MVCHVLGFAVTTRMVLVEELVMYSNLTVTIRLPRGKGYFSA